MGIDIDAAEIVRRLVAWGQGRMDERLLWMFARKCGDCMDWAIDIAGKHDTNVTLWEGYYKGPTYTEFPVTHFFYNKNINLDYTYGNSEGIGNVALMPCFEEELKKAGVTLMYRTSAVQFLQDANKRVTGLIAGRPNNYAQINAAKGVIIATGCYGSNEEMRKAFAPYSLHADAQIYFPTKSNTGDAHIMAMQVGGVMQKNDNHAATVHLEAGAGIWHTSGLSCPLGTKVPGHTASQAFNTKQTGYILVDQNGKRFINEKQIEHHAGILAVNYFDSYEMKYPRIPCYAIFDANSKEDGAFAPSYGSGWLRHREKWNWSRSNDKEIEAGIVKVGQNIQELAEKIGVDAKNLQATIGQWNSDLKGPEKKDSLFGRTLEGHVGQVWPHGASKKQSSPLDKPPYYAIELFPAILNTQGGPRHNSKSQVLNPFGQPIPRLYVAGELGSFWGFIYQGCGNNAEALIFGRIAGEEASKEKRWS